MRTLPEVMQLVDGHLFDAEWYERTELLHGSLGGRSGYCVVLWPSSEVYAPDQPAPAFMGPFPSEDVAYTTAEELR
jgi:hypothetical protein